jgi:peroxiredoxin
MAEDSVRKTEQAVLAPARAAGLALRDVTHSRINRNGLAAGAVAPDFSLPDIHGTIRSSAEFHGKRTLLVFSDPDCEPCQRLVPMLVQSHPSERVEQPQIVMISRGDPEANRVKAEQQGISFPVLIQNGWAISRKYGIFAAPVGYLVSPAGQIEQPVAIGAEAILQLATADPARHPNEPPQPEPSALNVAPASAFRVRR